MATFLLTWNPSRWSWNSLERDRTKLAKHGYLDATWSCGVTRRIKEGDSVFLLKQGDRPRGLMAKGVVTKSPFPDDHFEDPSREAWYIGVQFHTILNPTSELLITNELPAKLQRRVHWSAQASGISIPPNVLSHLLSAWEDHLRALGKNETPHPDEVPDIGTYPEGAVRRVLINAFERNTAARKSCLDHHGTKCAVCGMDFGSSYGEVARGFTHVHHVRPISKIRKNYSVDPIKDLIPVCPNCHAVIHMCDPPMTINQTKELMRRAKRVR